MARTMNTLSATAVKAATYKGKATKLFDGGGLFLHVTKGGKYWRLKYRYGGKEKLLALGVYPQVSLQAARKGRDEARELLAQGIEPSAHRRATKAAQVEAAANTFEAVAREWYEAVHRHKVVPTHAVRNLRRLEVHAFPLLGRRPIAEITPGELLQVLRRIECKGHIETAHRVKTLCGQVFRYAIPTGRAERDLSADLRDALRPAETKHHPALIKPEEIAPLLRAIENYRGHPATCAALKLAPLLFEGKMTGHGFRAMARTVLAERLNFPAEYIEQQLAHAVRDANGRAYNRTTHIEQLEQRRDMLQTWADYLDRIKAGAEVIPLNQQA